MMLMHPCTTINWMIDDASPGVLDVVLVVVTSSLPHTAPDGGLLLSSLANTRKRRYRLVVLLRTLLRRVGDIERGYPVSDHADDEDAVVLHHQQ
jgi:hypothetical protein